jgi:hypothetical protein
MVVDSHFTEFIDDNGDAAAMFGSQNAVQQRSLAGAEKTGENRDRHALVVVGRHKLEIPPELASKINNDADSNQ